VNDFYQIDDPVVLEVYRARTALIYLKPLLGEVALQMDLVIVESDVWCKTAATDGRRIYFNREFVIGLFFDANVAATRNNGHNRLVAIMAHEVWHHLFGHLLRRGNRDKDYWNMAVDYIVNATIRFEKTGTLPAGHLYDKLFTMDHTAEEVYDYLVANNVPKKEALDAHIESGGTSQSGDDQGSGDEAGSDDPDVTITQGDMAATISDGLCSGGDITVEQGDVMPEPLTAEESKRLASHARLTAIKVAQEGAAGRLPAQIQRQIDDTINSKLDWRKIINTALRSIDPFNYTYDELSDVTWASWIYHRANWHPSCGYKKGFCAILPTQSEDERVEAFIAIDTSASVTNEMISAFLSEIASIMESFNDFELRILCFDAVVGEETVFTKHNIGDMRMWKKTKITGGGGTDFMAVFEYLAKIKLVPDRLIICTDGYPAGAWGKKDYCPTIFMIHDKDQKIKAPFGETAYLD
jgi:predicted metal-dependent peptidase